MISIILHSIIASIFLIGAVILYFLWKKRGFPGNYVKDMFYLFLFFTFYHFSLSLPFLIFRGNLTAMAWGYIVALAFIFLILLYGCRIILIILGLTESKIKFIRKSILFLGLMAITVLIGDFRLPFFIKPGFVIWNGNMISGWITFAIAFAVCVIWASTFFRNKPREFNRINKLKAIFYAIAFSLIAISCIYFLSATLTHVLIAFMSHTLGAIFITIPVILSKLQPQTEKMKKGKPAHQK